MLPKNSWSRSSASSQPAARGIAGAGKHAASFRASRAATRLILPNSNNTNTQLRRWVWQRLQQRQLLVRGGCGRQPPHRPAAGRSGAGASEGQPGAQEARRRPDQGRSRRIRRVTVRGAVRCGGWAARWEAAGVLRRADGEGGAAAAGALLGGGGGGAAAM